MPAAGPAEASREGAAPAVSEAERAVLESIRSDDVVALTRALVDAGGENPGGTEERTAQVLEQAGRARGLAVRLDAVAPGRPNVDVELPPGGPVGDGPGLLFLGHSDVVPAGPGWSREPFRSVVADGRLYGRGATDMKGGLAAVVVALDALRRAQVPLTGPVRLACTVDEEDLGLGIRHLARRGLGRAFRGCVVAEPTDLQTVVACRGDAYVELEVTGVPAHSGRPADGRNAIDAASRVLEVVRADHERRQRDRDPLLGAGSWNVGRIEGGRTSSMVAPSCHVWLDRRLMPDEDPQLIVRELLAAVDAAGIPGDGISVSAEVTMAMPGFRTAPDHPLVRTMHDAVAALGGPASVGGWTAACDGGFIARDHGVPTVVMGPGGLNDQAHQVDESVGVEELVIAARAYALAALRLLG
ncbi:M20 family peptidase [Citricoccus sp. SGAir0253]|uniref:M20 family metallopeptidase n=1 Tax=Citricoccus sp. SGAir0253 TaxID=2567881 RepID=UPI0010CD590F|nr:M20 family metallopeptidase [Citricoccus sp. SGAir0253]QCU78973.1 M20 family peptidase [Citricoccus sp. SGAir0253]